MITIETLHEAADKLLHCTDYEEVGVEKEAIEKFIEESIFHPPLDAISMTYGILVGVMATKEQS